MSGLGGQNSGWYCRRNARRPADQGSPGWGGGGGGARRSAAATAAAAAASGGPQYRVSRATHQGRSAAGLTRPFRVSPRAVSPRFGGPLWLAGAGGARSRRRERGSGWPGLTGMSCRSLAVRPHHREGQQQRTSAKRGEEGTPKGAREHCATARRREAGRRLPPQGDSAGGREAAAGRGRGPVTAGVAVSSRSTARTRAGGGGAGARRARRSACSPARSRSGRR